MGNACCTSIIRFLDTESNTTVFMSGIRFRICLNTNKKLYLKGGSRLDCLGKVKCSVGDVKYSILC